MARLSVTIPVVLEGAIVDAADFLIDIELDLSRLRKSAGRTLSFKPTSSRVTVWNGLLLVPPPPVT